MKKIILLLLIGISVAHAQQSKLISTSNYLETGELDKAKDAINAAIEHEQTKNLAKTWYYRGMVYHAIFETKEAQYRVLHTDPLNEAIRSYMKILKYDTKKIDMDDLNMRLKVAANQSLNKGVREFNKRKYNQALISFENGITINEYFNTVDTLAFYNAALSAENLGNKEKAKKYYQKCIELSYGGANIYTFLSSIYKKEDNKEKAFEIIIQGRTKYPDNQNLLLEELNYYLENNQYQKAKDNLNRAINNDPTNATLYYSRGTMYDKLEQYNLSEVDYLKAIELQPDYFDAIYNLGALYYNQGVELNNLANTITDNVKLLEEKKQADKKFELALPYLEKAQQINPNDRNTMLSLKQLYERMENAEKLEEINQKLKK